MARHDMEGRFHRFAMQMPSAESIDALVSGTTQGRRADYLWRDRSVVVELKVLSGDPSPKIDRAFEKLSQRDDFPLFIGPSPVDKVFRHLADGDEQMRRLHQQVLRSTESAFRNARHQVINTKNIFGLDDALGLLVVLNPDIETLSPVDVGKELSRLLERMQSDCWAIDVVWLLSEAHVMVGGHPCIVIEGSKVDRFGWSDKFLAGLNEAWARFNRSTVLTTNIQDLVDLPVEAPIKVGPTSRSEMWRKRYQSNPYLSSTDDVAVKKFGEETFALLLPHFLKDGARRPMKDLEPLMIRWSDFLEEARRRGLDMREFGSGLTSL